MNSSVEYKKEKIRQLISEAQNDPFNVDWGELYFKIIAVMEGRM